MLFQVTLITFYPKESSNRTINSPLNSDRHQCPSGEVYKTCERRCTESCDDNLCSIDTEPCEEGCFCPGPWMVRVDGECVLRLKCELDKLCGPNESLNFGSRNDERCKNVTSSESWALDSNEEYDIDFGCFCNEGFRRVDGKCVPLSECPCREDMYYETCALLCDYTCHKPDLFCPDVCIESCVCPPQTRDNQERCVPLNCDYPDSN